MHQDGHGDKGAVHALSYPIPNAQSESILIIDLASDWHLAQAWGKGFLFALLWSAGIPLLDITSLGILAGYQPYSESWILYLRSFDTYPVSRHPWSPLPGNVARLWLTCEGDNIENRSSIGSILWQSGIRWFGYKLPTTFHYRHWYNLQLRSSDKSKVPGTSIRWRRIS